MFRRPGASARACCLAMILALFLSAPINSEDATNSRQARPTPAEGTKVREGDENQPDNDLSTILQLRKSVGINPLAGTLLDTQDDGERFAQTLGHVVSETGSSAPIVEDFVDSETDQLVDMLRTVSELIDKRAAMLERANEYRSADKLRKLARRNRRIARSLHDDKGD